MFRTLVITAALLSSSAAIAAPPAAFLKKAIQGNFSEVTLGRIIQQRGSTDQVRQFGAMLVTDHSKGLSQAQQIASRMRLRIWATIFRELQYEVDETGSIVDGSVVRAHQDASGGKGGSNETLWAVLEEVFQPNSTRSSTPKAVRSTSRSRRGNATR